MKFRYKRYALDVIRPVISIEVIHKDRSVPYEILVDSGADFCVFHAEIADLLDIDLEAGRPADVAGITGNKARAYFHPVKISIGGRDYDIMIAFLGDMGRFGYGVVGQRGFFDLFVVKFDIRKEEIELTPRTG